MHRLLFRFKLMRSHPDVLIKFTSRSMSAGHVAVLLRLNSLYRPILDGGGLLAPEFSFSMNVLVPSPFNSSCLSIWLACSNYLWHAFPAPKVIIWFCGLLPRFIATLIRLLSTFLPFVAAK